MRARMVSAAICFVGIVGCGASSSERAPAAAPTASAEMPARGPSYALVEQSTACFMGGLWSDALGEEGDARMIGIRSRCNALLDDQAEWSDDAYYPLRALDRSTVDRIGERVTLLANEDQREREHASELRTLFDATAAAARETLGARRAADKLKEDASTHPSSADYRTDEESAAGALESSGAVRALLHAKVGPYETEARAVGWLMVIDRIEIARALPKHAKILAVQGVFEEVFGVPPPALPLDSAAPLRTGTWLGYETRVAAAAGHDLPASAGDPDNLEPLAWNSTLEGAGDRLRAVGVDLPPGQLRDVTGAVAMRIDRQYRSEQNAFRDHAR